MRMPVRFAGRYRRIDGDLDHGPAEPLGVAIAFFWDHWRRLEARRLIEERGLPAELVRQVWDALPYESVPFRFGWDEWRRRREASAPP
jgi:hypothetical protein